MVGSLNEGYIKWLIDPSIDDLIDGLIGWLSACVGDMLVYGWPAWLIEWLVNDFISYFIELHYG